MGGRMLRLSGRICRWEIGRSLSGVCDSSERAYSCLLNRYHRSRQERRWHLGLYGRMCLLNLGARFLESRCLYIRRMRSGKGKRSYPALLVRPTVGLNPTTAFLSAGLITFPIKVPTPMALLHKLARYSRYQGCWRSPAQWRCIIIRLGSFLWVLEIM